MTEFRTLTKDEVALVFESIEPHRTDLKQLSVLEMVKDFKTTGWLVMAKIPENGKLKRVGIAHAQLRRPLYFEDRKDAELYVKKAKQLLKELKSKN